MASTETRAEVKSSGRIAAVVLVVAAAVVSTPAAAPAGEIDNDTEADVFVYFNCGVTCGGTISIKRGGSVATTGAGNVHAGFPVKPEDRKSPWKCESSNLWVSANADGEVGVTYDPGKQDADTGDVVPGTEKFIWVSKNGYDQNFRTVHDVQTMGGDGSYCWGGHW